MRHDRIKQKKIITIIYAHLDSNEKYLCLVTYIDTIKNAYMAVSSDKDFASDKIIELLSKTNVFYVERMAQFQAYKYLIEKITDNDAWIVLADNIVRDYNIVWELKDEKYVCCGDNILDNYCVRVDYCKLFFLHCCDVQLRNRYCDVYYIKFLTHCDKSYNSMIMNLCSSNIKDLFDLFMASCYELCNVHHWLSFCQHHCVSFDDAVKKLAIKYYSQYYAEHIFNNKNISSIS